MDNALNSPNSAISRRSTEHFSLQRFRFQRFSFTQPPLFPTLPAKFNGRFRSLPQKANSWQDGLVHWIPRPLSNPAFST